MRLVLKIEKLKKKKDAVILAHYYVNDEIQEIAVMSVIPIISSKIAVELPQMIVFCGVTFIRRSAKNSQSRKTRDHARPG